MIKQLFRQINREYGLNIRSYRVIHNTDKTVVIHLKTDRGSFFAKCMYATVERQQFIVEAEKYLRKRGISIPRIEPTLQGNSSFYWNGRLFYLQEETPGKLYGLSRPNNIKKIGALLGQFHSSSVGFRSSSGKLFNGSLSWEQEYEADLLSMENWQKQHAHKRQQKIKLIQKHLPFFLRAGHEMQKLMQHSSYFQRWKGQPEHLHKLCHGDFHMGNILKDGKKLHVIDWEDVRYDHPSKDLTRLLYVLMRKHGKWDKEQWQLLMNAYFKQNPMGKAEKNLLYQDLAFPHIFERFLRRKLYTNMSYEQVSRFLERERAKTRYMLKMTKARISK